jgi:hypothetical protein
MESPDSNVTENNDGSQIGDYERPEFVIPGQAPAGSTVPFSDSDRNAAQPHTWSHCRHETFHLRHFGYAQTSAKKPSPVPLMELVGTE